MAAPIKVRMLEDGFIEGRRRRKGEVLHVFQPHMVSFKAMELFKEEDVEIVKQAKKKLKAKKRKPEVVDVDSPKVVQPKSDDIVAEGFKIDPDTGQPVGPGLNDKGKIAAALPGRPQQPEDLVPDTVEDGESEAESGAEGEQSVI